MGTNKDRFGGPFFISTSKRWEFSLILPIFRIIHAFYHINLTLRFHSSSYFPYYY
ncbi:hypothetical protein CSC17_4828 [Klebsiella oxytoca]|nr:hypothetical protein CSC17_4828 [Klebsiella oxytoca]EUC87153.1 hypothetical protein HMPREF1570_3585 [Klebsiella oxytoca KA-2]EUC91600.1 hypothetical protein HMPREF1569_4308 [Klebsiella oxytoca OK-1]